VHFLDRLLRTPLRPVTKGIRIEVRFIDWFQQTENRHNLLLILWIEDVNEPPCDPKNASLMAN